MGVLLLGPSGIGKSECALELVRRGHRLVADDVVEVLRSEDGEAFGHNDHFAPVRLRGSAPQGAIVDARVTAAAEDHLIPA